MQILADTNIFLAVALNEPSKNRILELTNGSDLIAPALLFFEIGNALSAMVKRRQLSSDECVAAYAEITRIPVRLLEVDIERALTIAVEHRIYAYDAYFLECCRQHSCPLLTLDNQMQKVAQTIGIKVLE